MLHFKLIVPPPHASLKHDQANSYSHSHVPIRMEPVIARWENIAGTFVSYLLSHEPREWQKIADVIHLLQRRRKRTGQAAGGPPSLRLDYAALADMMAAVHFSTKGRAPYDVRDICDDWGIATGRTLLQVLWSTLKQLVIAKTELQRLTVWGRFGPRRLPYQHSAPGWFLADYAPRYGDIAKLTDDVFRRKVIRRLPTGQAAVQPNDGNDGDGNNPGTNPDPDRDNQQDYDDVLNIFEVLPVGAHDADNNDQLV